MNKARDWVGENASTINERRLSKDAQGVVHGGTFKPKSDSSLTGICAPQTLGGTSQSAGISLPQANVVYTSTSLPLTADQRVDQLNKKIAEYRNFLNAPNVAGSSSLIDLFFVNIAKELNEIKTEIAKLMANQYSPALPAIPSTPQIPAFPNWPNLPNIADSVRFYAQTPAETGVDQTYPRVIPSGVAYSDTFSICTNNNEDSH